jgi:hypothetical protein
MQNKFSERETVSIFRLEVREVSTQLSALSRAKISPIGASQNIHLKTVTDPVSEKLCTFGISENYAMKKNPKAR